MARRRFFVSEIRKGGALVEGDEARHLTRVLRVEAGQRYEISDGARVYLAEVAAARKEFVEFHIIEDLLAALIKFDHFELLIEKATELGVSEIVPVTTARTELGLEKAVPKRLERWQRIALEASQQSRRDHLPKISPAVQFGEALQWDRRWRYWLDEESGGAPLLTALPHERSVIEDTVALVIGPEGGWTPSEREAAARKGWTRVSLGPQILRAETAAIASLAVVMSAWQQPLAY
jgi:16S rRNA (uracil1498-N3)-methyltransferase